MGALTETIHYCSLTFFDDSSDASSADSPDLISKTAGYCAIVQHLICFPHKSVLIRVADMIVKDRCRETKINLCFISTLESRILF